MFITNHNSFRASAPGSPRIPLIDSFQLVTTSDTAFYQLTVQVKTHSHSNNIDGRIDISHTCKVDFKITNTFLIQQHNCLVLVGGSDKFGLFDLSGGCLKYYDYPVLPGEVQFCVTDVTWARETNTLLFSCVDLPIQRFNYARKQWDDQLEATFAYPDITKMIISHCKKYLCFVTSSGSLYYHIFGTNEVDSVETTKSMSPTLLRFAPTSQPYLVLGYPKGHIEIIDLEKGTSITYQVKDYSTVIDISFSPQNQNSGLIATSTGRLLQANFDEMVITPYKLLNKTIHTMEFGLDDCTLITSDYNNSLHVFNRYDPNQLLASIKIDTQFPISKFMPVRCRKWSKITIKSEQTSPKLSPSSERRNSISLHSISRSRSNSIVSASSILQKPCSPTSPSRRNSPSISSIRLVNCTPPKPNGLDNYMTLFSPAKNPNQFTQSSKSAELKPKHSYSKSHLPKLESLLSQPQTRSRSRSHYSDTSSNSAGSPTRVSIFPEEPSRQLRASTPTKKSRQYHSSQAQMERFVPCCESPNQLSYDLKSQSQATDSDNASDEFQSTEQKSLLRNQSHLSLISAKSLSNFSRRPSWQSSKTSHHGISIMSPIKSSFLKERQVENPSTSKSEIETMMERVCGRIENRVQERIDTSQAQLLAQNAALQEQIIKMGQVLKVIPDIMDELKQLREENKILRRDRSD